MGLSQSQLVTKSLHLEIYRYPIYNYNMIRNFKSGLAEDIFNGTNSRQSRKLALELHGKAHRLLDQIHAATQIETLKVPPSNNLEKLEGILKGFWSIRINIKWRIIFRWEDGDASDVDIVDYH